MPASAELLFRDDRVEVYRITPDEIAVFEAGSFRLLADARTRMGRWEISVDERATTQGGVLDFFKALTAVAKPQGGGA